MTNKHPVIPSKELISTWCRKYYESYEELDCSQALSQLLIEVAQWGADVELEECCKEFESNSVCGTKFQRRSSVRDLRDKRRPKPKKVSMTVSITGTEADLENLFQTLAHDREISIQFR